MGNNAYKSAAQELLLVFQTNIFPLIDQNLIPQQAEKLKKKIKVQFKKAKEECTNVNIKQFITKDVSKGELKEIIGIISMFVQVRWVFDFEKIQIEGSQYVSSYFAIETKGIGNWKIALDARVRVRIGF